MTYTIQRYPVHLIDVVRVADGSRVTIRPTLPQDIDLQRTFFRSLSAEARRLRFMTRLAELPAALVERFANADHASHVALLAEVFENGRERMIGEARYVVDGHDPAACEFAIAVADDWQRSGIARGLLDRLEHEAARSGVRRMAADTFATNQPMIALAMCTGYANPPSHPARPVRLVCHCSMCHRACLLSSRTTGSVAFVVRRRLLLGPRL